MNTENHFPKLVDLGLPSGTLWADHNLRADTPEDAGDYFRFGETTPFTEDSKPYEYYKIENPIAGTELDAATAILGKDWRTPDFAQIKELHDNCEWEWTTLNGVKGLKITGPNGNSIFVPAAGYRYSSGSLDDVGAVGCYWTATPDESRRGCRLGFNSSNWGWSYYYRACGFSVRPVAKQDSQE